MTATTTVVTMLCSTGFMVFAGLRTKRLEWKRRDKSERPPKKPPKASD